jgi:hypothetical protein
MVDRDCEICGEEFESRAGAPRCNDCRKKGRRSRGLRNLNGREHEIRDTSAYMRMSESIRLDLGLRMMRQDGR